MMYYDHNLTEICDFVNLFHMFAEVLRHFRMHIGGELGLCISWSGGSDGHGSELVGRAMAGA